MCLLNLYWYKLILKGLKRLLENAGILQKPDDDNYNELDKFEADAQVELVQEGEDETNKVPKEE